MDSGHVRDRYDEEVERLTADPIAISKAWVLATPLFAFACKDKNSMEGCDCGCLTMIRGESIGSRYAQTKELTDAIMADERIPLKVGDIRPENLPVFAEWQRRVDRELGRTPPQMLNPLPTCPHEFVNVGFNSITMACKHCGLPEGPQGNPA